MPEEGKPFAGAEIQATFGDSSAEVPVLPLRVVVLAELTARDPSTGKSVTRLERLRIDKSSFDEVMAGFEIRTLLEISDELSSSEQPIAVELKLDSLRSLGPEAIVAQLASARPLHELRLKIQDAVEHGVRSEGLVEQLRDSVSRLGLAAALEASLLEAIEPMPQENGAPAAEGPSPDEKEGSGDGNLEALLDLVDAPATAAQDDKGALDSVVRNLVRRQGGVTRSAGGLAGAVNLIDQALGLQVDAVQHHPEFQRLEAAWRGLRFLVDRTDFESSIQLEVVSVDREDLVSVFDSLVSMPELQAITDTPVSFVVVDLLFDQTSADIDLLTKLTQRAAALSAPLITGAGAGFLGLSSSAELAELSGIGGVFDNDQFTKWRALRDSGASRWLGIVFNRFLLRSPYGSDGLEVRGFRYQEAGGDDGDYFLWGNPAWCLAALATASFSRIGWCTDLMGQRKAARIEDLPVRTLTPPGRQPAAFPLETTVADGVERDLSDNGIMALTGPIGRDRAQLRFAPTAHRPEHYQDAADRGRARLQSTLPFQMFVGRSINYSLLLERRYIPGHDKEEVVTIFDKCLKSLLGSAGPVPDGAVQVSVLPSDETEGAEDLEIVLEWPGFRSLPGAGVIRFRWPLES